MCGIVGIVGKHYVNQALYDALTVLQHRGQDAAGIATCDEDGRFFLHKDNGLVRDVFDEREMRRLTGCFGIGHVRYPTAGTSSAAEAQPLYVNSPYGIALAHNGNLTNSDELIRDIYASDLRHINTRSDSEALLNVFAHELQRQAQLRPNPDAIFTAVAATHRRVRGAYAVVAMISGYGLVAFRDPFAIRPLIYGVRDSEDGLEYMIASESVALESQGYTIVRDLEPGECLIITADGNVHHRQCADTPKRVPCIFEYVYFARPDSTIDGINVYKARLRMGEKLAERIRHEWPEHDIDVVIPIPDTSRSSAIELAAHLGVKYREGFVKNRYIGRTFIMPGQAVRQKSVRQKLNAMSIEFKGKNVLLVDDSIVRGTTSREIVQMVRDAGASKVFLASAAPPVRFPNVYGIDMPTREELVAHGRSTEEICQLIGCDALIYQDVEAMRQAIGQLNAALPGFDASCFDGIYVTGDITEETLARMQQERRAAEAAQAAKQEDADA